MEITSNSYKRIIDFLAVTVVVTGIYLALNSIQTVLFSKNKYTPFGTRLVLSAISVFAISIAVFFVISVAILIKIRLEKSNGK